jgi:hypothetical protein
VAVLTGLWVHESSITGGVVTSDLTQVVGVLVTRQDAATPGGC